MLDPFMVVFEGFDGVVKSLPRRKVVQPDFLEQTRASTHHILMRNAVRSVKASNIQPSATVPHNQHYCKSHEAASNSSLSCGSLSRPECTGWYWGIYDAKISPALNSGCLSYKHDFMSLTLRV